MTSEPGSKPDKLLTSWKEIAAFFGRDVRTLQRWEKEEGLPIHRHLHHRQSSVYAYPRELEEWWRKRGSDASEQPEPPAVIKAKRWILWAATPATIVLVGLAAWLGLGHLRKSPPPPAFRSVVSEGSHPAGSVQPPLTGDVNGDGYDELVTASWSGREIHIIFGGAPGLASRQIPSAASVVITGRGNARLAVLDIGDYNGDGIQDLLLTETENDPDSSRAAGRSYILWGRKRWPSRLVLPEAADVTLRLDGPAHARIVGCATPGKRPDLNLDGVDEVLLAAPEYGFGQGKGTGALFVLFGRKRWPRELEVSSAADVTIRGFRIGEGLDRPCALGDFGGEGRSDLAVFAHESTLRNLLGGGKVYVFRGRKAWPRVVNAETDFDLRIDTIPVQQRFDAADPSRPQQQPAE